MYLWLLLPLLVKFLIHGLIGRSRLPSSGVGLRVGETPDFWKWVILGMILTPTGTGLFRADETQVALVYCLSSPRYMDTHKMVNAVDKGAEVVGLPPGVTIEVGPLTGGPLAGGPLAGGPLVGRPLAGGPLAGGPLVGRPLAGGPFAGEASRSLAAPEVYCSKQLSI
jgi:hypothetical protein